MDDTQRLDYNDDEDETSVNRDRPVGNLHMFAGIHGPAQDFPIYHGENLIGRHASCDITLPAQSVSKKHAMLEVTGDIHTICDNASLNKTRRGKVALAPHVRYSLSGGDFLLFADVACRYTRAENVESETIGVVESEDDSVLVPATQGALAIEKTPGAAIRRIARGTVLARDSGDEDEDEEGQTRWNEGGVGSFKDSCKSSGPGSIFSPVTDTIVPESDEEIDTSTSETRLPSLNLRCDSDTDSHDASRRSSFVPSSQNISTPLVLKDHIKHGGGTLTAIDKEETKSSKQTDPEIKLRLAVEDTTDGKDTQEEEQTAESTSGGSVAAGGEACADHVGSVDDKLKIEPECGKTLQGDALEEPSADSIPVIEEKVTSSSSASETVPEVPCEMNAEVDALVQDNDVKVEEDNVRVRSAANVQEADTTTAGTDVNTAETSGIQTNQTADEGNGRSLGSSAPAFHMDSDTDEDEAATTEAELEKDKSRQIADLEESENNANVSLTGENKGDSDSDTDVEDDRKVLKSKSDDEVNKKMAESSKIKGTTGLGIDSDTDDDDDADISKTVESKADQVSRSNTEEKKEGIHLDSDTDVEEDVSTAEAKEEEPESPKASVKETKGGLNVDSDTDVDEEVDVSSRDVTREPQDSSVVSTDVKGVDSDTDVDEDGPTPGESNVTLEKTSTDEEQKEKTSVSDVVTAEEVAALHADSDTDVDEDDGLPVAPVMEKAGAPESIADTDTTKDAEMGKETADLHLDSDTDNTKDAEMGMETADLHLDSDTDVEEGDDESSTVSRQEEKEKADSTGGQEEVGVEDQKSDTENATVSGISTEETKNIPEKENSMEEGETPKSDAESVDLEMMPTQCYLEPQEESDLQDDDEEATQAFIFSSTWAEPDPFKRPADPIAVLQISSVTLNASEEEIDENAIAETQAFCTDVEPIGPSVQETPEPVERSADDTIRSSSSEGESGKEVQQLSHEAMSLDATQPVSQYMATESPQETGNWLHLKRDVPASVWLRDIQQEGDSSDLEGANESAKDTTQADEQSLKLELEATQSYSVESPSLQKPTTQTQSPAAPVVDEDNKEPGAEKMEQTCSEDTQATDDDATQAYSLDVLGPENGATPASSLSEEATGDGATQAASIEAVATDDDNTQVNPTVPAAEEVVPETSTESQDQQSTRKGPSRSKKKAEPAEKVQTASEVEEHLDQTSAGPSSLTEKRKEQRAGETQLSEPEIKDIQVEQEGRRRGGRRIAESQSKATAKEEVLVAKTFRKTASKISPEEETSTSRIEPHGRKQVSRKSAKKVVSEELTEEREQSSSTTEKFKESFVPEILPISPPEKIESLTSLDDKKGNVVERASKESSDQAAKNKEKLSTKASTIESEELMDSNDNSAEKESDSSRVNQNKKPGRNKRQVATRLRNKNADETQSIDHVEKDKNIGGHHLRTIQDKDKSKQTSGSLQSQQITQEESPARKATRKSRVKPAEPEPDRSTDTTAIVIEEIKKVEETCPADPLSGNEKSTRTRRSLREEMKEESKNIQEEKGKTRKSTSVKNVKTKEKEGNLEDMPAGNKISRRTRNNSKEETEPEVKEEDKAEENEAVRKSRKTQKNLKEEKETKDDIGTLETASSDAQTSRRTRRECRGEDQVVKEETVKETTSRRTRRQSKEEEVVKLEEDQTKKSRRTRKDSKEEAKTEESFLEEDKEETVGRKTIRKTRRNLKDDEKELKPTEEISKAERLSRTRAKTSDDTIEAREGVGEEKSPKPSPQEEKSKPAVGRGRRAANKEDLPQVSTPVSSRKRGQATKAEEVEVKRKKSDEGEEPEESGVVETPTRRRGRPRRLGAETENTQTGKEISPPDPSPSRSRSQRPSSALSNPPEARTPRRTNRMSASATSPYATQSAPAPKILFTGVVDTAGEEVIRSMGGEIAESVFDCTHLVTDRVRRTVKFLCALARGIPIVTLDWIDKCKKSRCFLSPTGFLVNDKEQEKSFDFLLSESLQKAQRRPLFEGYEIHVTANVKPEPDHMRDIIRCGGATFLPKMPRSFKEKCVVVSCAEDAARCKSVPASVPITSAEFILSGILRQEVNPTAYLLNPPVQDTAPTPAKRRR
ncbi:mediator of DNA damage checkpoint protein 1 isoform X2 [Rhinoderma darwinii]|uniref:mediator of DNA damage checkpoint protein 1 isoform X2 n=1 Tax=Rhinoderma darwinii TaxID=43563 RepID=UPI003F663485